MMNYKQLSFFFLLIFLPQNVLAYTLKDTLNCTLLHGATHRFNYGVWQADTGQETKPIQVTFTKMQSEHPIVVDSAGSTKLNKLDNEETIYLLEKTFLGHLDLWTFWPKTMSVAWKRQFSLLGLPAISIDYFGSCNYL